MPKEEEKECTKNIYCECAGLGLIALLFFTVEKGRNALNFKFAKFFNGCVISSSFLQCLIRSLHCSK